MECPPLRRVPLLLFAEVEEVVVSFRRADEDDGSQIVGGGGPEDTQPDIAMHQSDLVDAEEPESAAA